jgi:hypothetical protein
VKYPAYVSSAEELTMTSGGQIALRPQPVKIAPTKRIRFLAVVSYVIVLAILGLLWTRVPGALDSPSGFFRLIGAVLLVVLAVLSVMAAVVVPALVLWPRVLRGRVVLAADGISLSTPGKTVLVPWAEVDRVSVREVAEPPALLAAAWLRPEAGARLDRNVRRFQLISSGTADGPLWLGDVGAGEADQEAFGRKIHQWLGRPVVFAGEGEGDR